MNSDHGQFDNVTDDDNWPQDEYGGRGSSSSPHRLDAYQEYDEARRLLRDMDDNYYRRRERGFSTHAGHSNEPQFSDEDFSAHPSSSPRPPVDYVRPSDYSIHHGQSPTYHGTQGLPSAFESGQFSRGGSFHGSRRARFADRSPPPDSSSRSHDPDFGDPHSSDRSKGNSRLGRFFLGA